MNKTPKDLAPTALPHGAPVEATDAYYKSLKETKTRAKKYPAWDVARPSPQVLILQSRRELIETEELFDEKRDEEAQYRTTMNSKWKELREKKMFLKESFISFNKFIRENEEKRRRTDRQLEADIEMYERKCRETEEIKKRLAEMEDVKEKMEQQVRDYTIYEDYLMSVIRKYPQFKQPSDILNRYESLAAAKSYLADRQQREMEELGSSRQAVSELTEEKRHFIMGLNNKLADLRWRYDKVRKGVIKWDVALNRLKETVVKRNAEINHVREAIWSLYTKICKQKGLTDCAQKTDFEQQLVVIMRALLELRMIYKIASVRAYGQKVKMRIKTFAKYIEDIAQRRHQLNDSTLVIDGQNVLYKFYVEKGLQFVFGCESNVFAECLKEYLSRFKKANVKCYFIFKGGHGNIEDKFNKKRDTENGTGNVSGPEHNDFVQPIFMKDVYTQVLDEMGFDYVICEYESKKEIMALAQQLNCSVCSYDIEFFFSGIPYVLYPSIEYNQDENKMTCSIITLDSFLQRFKLTDSLLAIFIVLTDIRIFPENHFMVCELKALNFELGLYFRY